MVKLKSKREIFVSEADFQLELAWIIKKQYQDALVRLEFCKVDGTNTGRFVYLVNKID